ncbi:P-loop containing nucleoside triphosphate hydrolase protein [Lentithecium fluviatile CBS 122367]|uniref:P-loop containing nucleoside triphosphate hydrolase protein n=1 Tax=Lentithecium fluviatile CBS 122367 TaxID=1168545 RepID=A0A6G1JF55_9PLEO|nr:P-loop containing nucleoside triphosphate hydrolase protein [Lentithecium fluviatile CBS 122367]
MASMPDTRDDTAAIQAGAQNETFRLRSYQTEMVEESMRANIIVVMDTGSGKTHIALARTAAELERSDPNKLVWFLAPTVALCEQQHRVFQKHLPGHGIQVLLGKDNVDHWSDQNTWDAVLQNIRIVLSTHQVLLEALTHGFVKMKKLALIIFDEAHHCTQKHPANLILANFYLPIAQYGVRTHLPKILGLSASPVMKATASIDALHQIEENMNAKAKTPKTHRSELLRFVHKPSLLRIDYPIATSATSPLLAALQAEVYNYDLKTDPYVADLLAKQREGYNVLRKLDKVLTKHDTYCYQQLKTLHNKSKDMAEELGTSVSEWYVWQCVEQFDKMIRTSEQQLLDWSHNERQHLSSILQRLPIPKTSRNPFVVPEDLSQKVERLVDVLVAEAGPECTGIVFIEQRVWVAALAEILSIHPRVKEQFSVGTFVGNSQSSKRKTNLASFVEPKNQQDTLDKFRAGETNLILATSVLEEGIDVSSCHLVICFERPKNLKSFVQRRGRARKQESKYYIFSPEQGNTRRPESWESLEEEMKKAYLDDLRKVKQAEEREGMHEDGERFYRVQSTGALLTLDNALPHLHHFCATLGSSAYVDLRPQYEFEEVKGARITAEVTLPLSVDPAIRITRGTESWETERMAMKDASFEAYRRLHAAGLVNENLLPVREEADDEMAEFQIADNTPSLIQISQTLDPWISIAEHQQRNTSVYHRTLIQVSGTTKQSMSMMLLTPVEMPKGPKLTLYWNEVKRVSITSSGLPPVAFSEASISVMRNITRRILSSVFPGRTSCDKNDFMWLLVPSEGSEDTRSHSDLLEWASATEGAQLASDLIRQGHHNVSEWGFISLEGGSSKYTPQTIDLSSLGPCIKATRVPKRRDFLHAVPESNQKNEAYSKIEELPISKCLVDSLPAAYPNFALLLPSILFKFETYMIADTLRTTLLAPLEIGREHLPLILRTLTGSGTGEEENYQRLEFFGDCILKFIASVHLMAEYPMKHESWLTGKKGKIVSNGFAARATIAAGLDKFILTKRFTGAKWAPRYMSDVLAQHGTDEKRTVSSKLLADVVESLIGASYVVGGFPKAFLCVQTLLPLENWTPIPEANTKLFNAVPADVSINSLSTVESLIGYTFTKKQFLLEALTHISYPDPSAHYSYERLEFLGDAVLDYIISKRLYAHTPELSHQKMHAIRSCMANAAFLAFRMFETTVQEELMIPATLQKQTHHRWLWQYLRLHYDLVKFRNEAARQHEGNREQILNAMQNEKKFPWHLLALNDAPKFLSDVVESVIGGIYVDSHGDIAACEGFVRRLGVLDCLQRILDDDVDCLHPKERLGHLAVNNAVQYVRVTDDKDLEGRQDGKKRMHRIQVEVGGEEVGGVVEGVKRLNAETRAAYLAVGILEQRGEGGDVGVDADVGVGVGVGGDVGEGDEEEDGEDGGGISLEEE